MNQYIKAFSQKLNNFFIQGSINYALLPKQIQLTSCLVHKTFLADTTLSCLRTSVVEVSTWDALCDLKSINYLPSRVLQLPTSCSRKWSLRTHSLRSLWGKLRFIHSLWELSRWQFLLLGFFFFSGVHASLCASFAIRAPGHIWVLC